MFPSGLLPALPFTPLEKQALLEASSLEERQELLFKLTGMGIARGDPSRLWEPPTVH